MQYSVVLDRLQNLINYKPTQADLVKILGIKQSTMSERAKRDSKFTPKEISLLNQYYNINLFTNNSENQNKINIEEITLDYYPDIQVSCGNGIIPFGETKEKITIPASFINNFSKSQKYLIVNAISDSMMPEIKPKDLLILRQTENEPIIDNHIYVFCYDERLYCKYLSFNVGQIIVRSANKDYPIRYIEGEDLENFRLLGEVCGHFRNYLI